MKNLCALQRSGASPLLSKGFVTTIDTNFVSRQAVSRGPQVALSLSAFASNCSGGAVPLPHPWTPDGVPFQLLPQNLAARDITAVASGLSFEPLARVTADGLTWLSKAATAAAAADSGSNSTATPLPTAALLPLRPASLTYLAVRAQGRAGESPLSPSALFVLTPPSEPPMPPALSLTRPLTSETGALSLSFAVPSGPKGGGCDTQAVVLVRDRLVVAADIDSLAAASGKSILPGWQLQYHFAALLAALGAIEGIANSSSVAQALAFVGFENSFLSALSLDVTVVCSRGATVASSSAAPPACAVSRCASSPAALSLNQTGLFRATRYRWRALVQTQAGWSPLSVELEAATAASPPGLPSLRLLWVEFVNASLELLVPVRKSCLFANSNFAV